MLSRTPLLGAALVLAAGIAIGLERPVPLGGGPLAFALAAAAMVLTLAAMSGRRLGTGVALAALALTGIGLGSAARAEEGRSCGARLEPEAPVVVEGVVESAAPPKLRIQLRAIRIEGARIACAGTVAARWDGAPPDPGEGITARGRWWSAGPVGAVGAGLLMLDTIAPAPVIEGNTFHRVRGAAARRLATLYGDRAGLASSLLLAQREGLDREVRDRFARAGLSHLLAISGLHVGLVAGVLLLLGRIARLRAPWPPVLAAAGTVAYVLFLGAPTAAARAALQAVLVLLAAGLQRPARGEALMAAAAMVLLAVHPASLAEPGFQLSFAGVAGLLVLRRPFLRIMGWLAGARVGSFRPGRWLADALASGLAATMATAPIVAWHFGQVAPIGVAANLPAIPLVAALVPTLALSLAAAVVWEPAGALLAGGGGVLLAALDATARAAAAVPGGSIPVTPWTAVLWTAAVVAGYAGTRRIGRVRPRVRLVAAAGVCAAVFALAAVRVASDRLELHVIDVGQGDAIALRSPAGRWLLVDAGVAREGFDAGARRVVPYLGTRGVRRLEALVLTHPDADHIGGASAVVRALRPRWVGDPGLSAGKAGYVEVLQAAAETGAAWLRLGDGMELELDGAVVEFLHPPAGTGLETEANEASVVMRVRYGEFSALLTGDASSAVEEELVRRWGAALDADVLKAGHHGSITSTSPALLGATRATVALISAGRGNRYGHPHPAVLARLDSAGVRVLRTDRDGSIVVRAGAGGRMVVEREREDG